MHTEHSIHNVVIVYDCLYAKLMKIENNTNTHTHTPTHMHTIKVYGEAFLAALKQNEIFRLNFGFCVCVFCCCNSPVVMMSISGVGLPAFYSNCWLAL